MDFTSFDDEIPTFSELIVAAAEEEDQNWLPYAPVFHTTGTRPHLFSHPEIPEVLAISTTEYNPQIKIADFIAVQAQYRT